MKANKSGVVGMTDCISSHRAAAAAAAESLQSCLTLCDPIDGSPPGSPILGSIVLGVPNTLKYSDDPSPLALIPCL